MPANFFPKGIKIQFKPFGKWDEAIRTIQKLKPSIKAASLAAQISVCKAIAKKVKGHIRNQDLGWRHLSKEYLKDKKAAGWDSRILMGTRAYYDAIEVIQKGNQHMIFVGVRRGIYTRKLNGKKNHLEVAQIANIHEFSRDQKRRRPLWNPTIKEMGGSKGIRDEYLQHLYKQLKRRKIPITKLGTIKWR